jgi:hypothetical protein
MKKQQLFALLVVLLVAICIYSSLIMVIWNKVIIKKFPNSNIQELSFFDALALGILCSLLFNSTYVINCSKSKGTN